MSNSEQLTQLQNVVKYSQALYSNGLLYYGGDTILATSKRKNMLRLDLKSIKQCIESIEKALSISND